MKRLRMNSSNCCLLFCVGDFLSRLRRDTCSVACRQRDLFFISWLL